jgi:hypothetical protein
MKQPLATEQQPTPSGQHNMYMQQQQVQVQQQQQPWSGAQMFSSSAPQHSSGGQLWQGVSAGGQEQPEWVYKKSCVAQQQVQHQHQQQQAMGPPAQAMLAGTGQAYDAPSTSGRSLADVATVLPGAIAGHQQPEQQAAEVGEQLKASVGACTVVRKRVAPLSLLGGAKSSRFK